VTLKVIGTGGAANVAVRPRSPVSVTVQECDVPQLDPAVPDQPVKVAPVVMAVGVSVMVVPRGTSREQTFGCSGLGGVRQ